MFKFTHKGTEVERDFIAVEVGSGFVQEVMGMARKRPNQVQSVSYGGYEFTVEYKLADVSMMEAVQLHFRNEFNGKYEFGYNGYDNVYVYTNPGQFYFEGNCGERFEHSRSFSPAEALAIVNFIEVNWPNWKELAKEKRPKKQYHRDAYQEWSSVDYEDEEM